MESGIMVLSTALSDTGHALRSTGQGLIASRAFVASERSVAAQLVVEMMCNLNDSIDDFALTYVAAIYELSVVVVVACCRGRDQRSKCRSLCVHHRTTPTLHGNHGRFSETRGQPMLVWKE